MIVIAELDRWLRQSLRCAAAWPAHATLPKVCAAGAHPDQ
jgi:hypothetical protein